jgi:uncharacterized OB-fold protein
MAIDALGIGAEPSQPAAVAGACPKCGSSNATGAKFCSECGERLPETQRRDPNKPA